MGIWLVDCTIFEGKVVERPADGNELSGTATALFYDMDNRSAPHTSDDKGQRVLP